MAANRKPISALRPRMIEDMRLRKLSKNPERLHPRRARVHRLPRAAPDASTAEDLRRCQLHLADSGVSRPSLNAAVRALRFSCEVTLGQAELTAKTSQVCAERTLPVILGRCLDYSRANWLVEKILDQVRSPNSRCLTPSLADSGAPPSPKPQFCAAIG
jgi:hypothetical protein